MKAKKTAIIFNIVPDEIKYFIVEGDCSHLQGVYLNAGYDKKQSDELTKIIYDDDWSFRYEPKEITEWRHTLCIERLPLIECGFIS